MLALALLLTSGWSFVSRTYGGEIQARPGDRIEVQHDGLTDEVTVSGRMADLEGYWRVREGPAQGWLMRGRNHAGRKVSLDTAPGVVLRGAWRDKDMDLRQDQAGTTEGILEDKVRPPAVLRALLDAETVGTGQGQALRGEADDAFPSRDVTLQKELWRIEIDQDKSASPVWFDPAAVEPAAAKVAQVRLNRSPYDFTFPAMNFDKFIAVRVRVLDAAGKPLGEPVTVTAAGERSVQQGAVTLELGPAVYATWTGLRDDGTPYPPGVYTLELVVRDGMAEAVLTHQVSLGTVFRILAVPDHFAPEHEQVDIAYAWFPERLTPGTVRLIVRGGKNGQEVVHDAEVFPQQTADGWKVQWSGRTHGGAAVDWARLKPFHIELEAVGRDGARRNAKAETGVDVKVVGLRLPPLEELKPPRPQGEAAQWYEANEIPADVAFIFAHATVTILDSQGQEKKVKQGVNIQWEYALEPEDTTDQPRSPARHFDELSGEEGLRDLISVLAKTLDAPEVAEATLAIAKKLDELVPGAQRGSLRLLTMLDIKKVADLLEPHEYAAFIRAVDRLYNVHNMSGFLTQAKLGDLWLQIVGKNAEALEATRRASRNFANVAGAASKSAARGHAFEAVLADWLVHGGYIKTRKIMTAPAEALRFGKDQIRAAGVKVPIGDVSPKTFEADIGALSEVSGRGQRAAIIIDCKCPERAFANLADDDLQKALKALRYQQTPLEIIFVSSKPWDPNTIKRTEKAFTEGITVDGKKLSWSGTELRLGELDIPPGSNLGIFLGM
jgi:hypothetical protein